MAITRENPRIKVHVECNGARLQEFDEDDGNTTTTTVTKYVEAKSGAEFAVQVEVHQPFPRYAMIVKLYIDGNSVRSRIIGDHQYQSAKGSVKRVFNTTVTKIADGQRTLQKFCFSELQIEESYDYNLGDGLIKDLKSIGVITLKAYYIENLREVRSNRKYIEKKQTGVGPIPEKALKGQALTHWAGLGTEVKEPYISSSHTDFDYVNLQRLPFAIFNFKYRSRAALQSLLVIPRSPSPQLTQAKDNETHLVNAPGSKQNSLLTKVKKEPGLKRKYPIILGGSEEDGEVSFVSAAKRPRPNITINENGCEIIDLT
ncbi:hypothetical protein COCVIDRAFT_14245 [Bipolaris victoriae FI3]|uniref:DUF7918 domain-containing protein n=1 Tax=Bipolaris victoriae (strain FI3) TaxID=930091 RepID=W7EPX9_BIPV3|nr:hypothetical protein COCVIDRAFT_14245 [Bipolaris victoriae FI3]